MVKCIHFEELSLTVTVGVSRLFNIQTQFNMSTFININENY